MIPAYPLQWPDGWPRARHGGAKVAQFGTAERRPVGDNQYYTAKRDLTMREAVDRVAYELERLGVNDGDFVVSTNLRLNLSGAPRGDQGEPMDRGAAVYWQKPGAPMRVLAIDRYTRVRDNIAAIAATLEAMRAIDRHGGAQILERAFTGFDALPSPKRWFELLGVSPAASADEIRAAWRERARTAHPDLASGSHERMAELNRARDDGLAAVATGERGRRAGA